MAWLVGWGYRKTITISRASGAVTNYQMKILVGESAGATGENVDCGGNIESDFRSLRFTTSDGTTLLDYFIEEITGTTPNQLATVWVEFDSIGTGATTFYLYYGNTGASSLSSGANTFMLFDDFERGSDGDALGGSWGDTTYCEIDTAYAKYGTRSGNITRPAGGNANTYFPGLTPSSGTYAIGVWIRIPAISDAFGSHQMYPIGHSDGTKKITMGIGGTTEDLQYYASTPSPGWVDTTFNMTQDTWQFLEVMNIDFSAYTYDIYVDGTIRKAGAVMQTSPGNNGTIGMGNSAAAATTAYNIDALRVRNWRSTEPAISGYGSEETPSGGGVPIFHHHLGMMRAS